MVTGDVKSYICGEPVFQKESMGSKIYICPSRVLLQEMRLDSKSRAKLTQCFVSLLQYHIQFIPNTLTHLNLKHTRLAQCRRVRFACPIEMRFVSQEPCQLQDTGTIDGKFGV